MRSAYAFCIRDKRGVGVTQASSDSLQQAEDRAWASFYANIGPIRDGERVATGVAFAIPGETEDAAIAEACRVASVNAADDAMRRDSSTHDGWAE